MTMATIKKTISLPDELYKEAEGISDNFSEIVKEALSEYIKRKKIEKALLTAGTLKNLKETGTEYVDKMRKEDLSIEEERIGR
jgi:metal-responsive CopG/Arc/MetJ family transcriptional regulator